MIFLMENLNSAQLKSLSEFANTIAAAWFTAGIISPFFTRPKTLLEVLTFVVVGLLMAGVTLRWSLSLLKGVNHD